MAAVNSPACLQAASLGRFEHPWEKKKQEVNRRIALQTMVVHLPTGKTNGERSFVEKSREQPLGN